MRQWTRDDYASLLGRIQQLCPGAQDQYEIDWDSLVVSSEPWTGSMLRSRWQDLMRRTPNMQEYSFMGTTLI